MSKDLLENINAVLLKENSEKLLLSLQDTIKDNLEEFWNNIPPKIDLKPFNRAVNDLNDAMENILISAGYGF